ncbi:MAG: zf-HC2 domain-containing protein [Ktedonobacteraceae bacterium]|nr:zf-HC2 domain-containing protein [Ktedonobacteraceae bacterium]
MRCRDAKQLLTARRDSNLTRSDEVTLQEHLHYCQPCRATEQQQQHLDTLLSTSAPRICNSIPTEKIMLAIQQQRRISQQLEQLRTQQQTRIVRLRTVGMALAAATFFTLGSIPLLLLAITIEQTGLAVKALSLLSNVIDVLYILTQYLQTGLTIATRNSWLLSGVAFAVVVMMGMWLRLMRYPQEA